MPDLTFSGLKAATEALAKDIARSSEAIRTEAKAIDDEADGTARDAESIASIRVDKASVAETHELSKIMRGLSEAVIAHAASGDTTARHALAARNQNQTSHGHIHEAMARSSAGSEVYDVDRRWVTPE